MQDKEMLNLPKQGTAVPSPPPQAAPAVYLVCLQCSGCNDDVCHHIFCKEVRRGGCLSGEEHYLLFHRNKV